MNTGKPQIDYRTHILVGVRADGVMTIIEDWPHVPTQVDVQETIDGARGRLQILGPPFCRANAASKKRRCHRGSGCRARCDGRSARILDAELTHFGGRVAHGFW
jgi:hypothetical protein